MKKWLSIFILTSCGVLSGLATAGWGDYGTSEGPTNWGPWYLYQAKNYTYTIECVYKRKEIKQGGGSILTETRSVHVARYPFGYCSDTITF